MRRKRLLVLSAVLALVVLSLLLASAAFAKQVRRGRPVQWDPPKIREEVSPGQVFTTTVTLTATRDLGLVRLWVTPSLQGILTFTPSEPFTLNADSPQEVTITLTVPSEEELGDRDRLNGLLKVRKVRREGVRRAYPRHLRLRFPVTGETE